MKEKVKEFLEIEKTYIKVGLLHGKDAKRRDEIRLYARHRAIGAMNMAERCGLDYDTAEKMFYDYCDELEEMKNALC